MLRASVMVRAVHGAVAFPERGVRPLAGALRLPPPCGVRGRGELTESQGGHAACPASHGRSSVLRVSRSLLTSCKFTCGSSEGREVFLGWGHVRKGLRRKVVSASCVQESGLQRQVTVCVRARRSGGMSAVWEG